MRVKIFLLLILAVAACKKDAQKVEIESDVLVDFHEEINNGIRSFHLEFETVEEFGSSGYYIDNSCKVTGDKININLKGIIVPERGFCVIMPATCAMELSNCQEAEYSLSIKMHGKKSKGSIIINQDSYEVKLDEQNGLVVEKAKRNRIPQGTIWGTIQYSSDTLASLASELIDSIIQLGGRQDTYMPGDYFYFGVDDTGQKLLPNNQGSQFEKSFILHFEGEMSSLIGLKERYYTNCQGQVSLSFGSDRQTSW
ncbi:MAG: hypothetical protein KKA07_03055 [Bacteroidetes bacterium]|nr:hypothetical protein [Bacteroidota bacterium]MBU1718029.1 hypothetical protein [Bacteroidota bacterium]